jgi:hypothetical protein
MVVQIMDKTFIVQSSVFYRKDLNTLEKLIYILLCGLMDKNNQVSGISYSFIAKRCNVHQGTAVRRINSLRNKGFIEVQQRRITSPYSNKPTKITNLYTILDKEFNYDDIERCGYHGEEVIVLREQ